MKVPVPDVVPPAAELGRVHFVGIGGAGLSGIARIMLARGVPVSGSDGVDSSTLAALRALGATVHHGHAADHVGAADTVVVSTAVQEDNPEVVEARRLGLRLLPRSAALRSVMFGRRVVAVAGTHGKTTTTSLLTVALQTAGADPTYAIGGDLAATGVNAADGSGDLFVAEADESDGAFLHYAPFAAIVTNVDADHLDTWGTPEAYAAAFDDFVATLDPDGFLVVVADDPGAAALGRRHAAGGRRVITVSARSDAAVDLGPAALDGVRLWSPGEHYRADALAALAAGLELGLERDALLRGLASYTGTKRRMEPKGEAGGVRVYDSYAHHPTEIVGDLESARALAGEGRLLVAFQPHLVSRTRIFGAAMGEALGAADEVVLLDVYLAREPADPEVTGRLVADAVPLPPEAVHYVPDLDDVAAVLAARARPGDLVLTLGAGSITRVGPEVLALLEAGGADG
ncbi:UDP-N-acetylmuramate--L-alanine ligase [Nocardioides fonticola]|uniref:UDP-N-acetylmuramate--L-alanine ligase n=1 Tax=Nocardioides fonticola TaxID=450363 RepID=A0ABP7XA32_9ACTN